MKFSAKKQLHCCNGKKWLAGAVIFLSFFLHGAVFSLSSDSHSPADMRLAAHNYLVDVWVKITKNKEYPPGARAMQLEGEATICFILTATGEVGAIEVKKSSGNDILDQAALAAVRRAAPFPKPPQGLIETKMPVEITIVFKMT